MFESKFLRKRFFVQSAKLSLEGQVDRNCPYLAHNMLSMVRLIVTKGAVFIAYFNELPLGDASFLRFKCIKLSSRNAMQQNAILVSLDVIIKIVMILLNYFHQYICSVMCSGIPEPETFARTRIFPIPKPDILKVGYTRTRPNTTFSVPDPSLDVIFFL